MSFAGQEPKQCAMPMDNLLLFFQIYMIHHNLPSIWYFPFIMWVCVHARARTNWLSSESNVYWMDHTSAEIGYCMSPQDLLHPVPTCSETPAVTWSYLWLLCCKAPRVQSWWIHQYPWNVHRYRGSINRLTSWLHTQQTHYGHHLCHHFTVFCWPCPCFNALPRVTVIN